MAKMKLLIYIFAVLLNFQFILTLKTDLGDYFMSTLGDFDNNKQLSLVLAEMVKELRRKLREPNFQVNCVGHYYPIIISLFTFPREKVQPCDKNLILP